MTIKAIVFDFDGVITESMDIKTQAFAHLFRNYSEDIIKKVVKLHLDHGGMSRYEKFRIIYRDYLKIHLAKDEEERLGKEFSEFCYEKIITCPYVKGAKEFLEANHDKYKLFIVSGTPHDEINHLVNIRKLRKFLQGVWGTPGTKGELLNMILDKYALKPSEMVFIGDAPTDYEGAKEVGIHFIARIAPGQYNPFESDEFNIDYTVENLSSLTDILRKMDNPRSKNRGNRHQKTEEKVGHQ